MEKIAELLKQLGGTPELVGEITKQLSEYKGRVMAEAKATLEERKAQAKQICMEAVAEEKAVLQRKVEIFLEACIDRIEREATKQAAIGESEAVKTLRGIKALFEGVTNDASTEDQAATATEVKKLRVLCSQLKESNERLSQQATRANQIAMKALQRNKVLETKTNLKEDVQPEVEEDETDLSTLQVESAQPKTTRKVLVESQTKTETAVANSDTDVMAIANGIESAPAFMR